MTKPFFAVLALIMVGASRASAQAPDELKALEHWIGTWDTEMSVKQGPWSPEAKTGKGSTTGVWTLGNRFVEMRAKSDFDNGEAVTMVTWDEQVKTYRSWWFNSQGHFNQSTGTWDEQKRTMSLKGELFDGITFATTNTFSADWQAQSWQVIVKDKDGQVMFDMTGKSTKRK